ncbi:6-bladed beta-propeller [Candidatus Palauibacter sp.]|uniref:6-bladed beta-propeller n=1 Tax=Candidatus Palauibacter sp. TaxID=3101350 RepID=UPI003AF27DCC
MTRWTTRGARQPRSIWFATSGAILFSTAACAGGDAPPPEADVPTFEGTVDLEIGELEGEDPYLFTRVFSVAADPLGRILVTDNGAHEVRVFDPDGQFLFRLGGEGDGPGEFRSPCCVGFSPGGELWVRERPRYTVFELEDAGARYVRVVRRPFAGQGGGYPVAFDAEGRTVDLGLLPESDGRFVEGRIHLNPDGRADTVEVREPAAAAEARKTVEFASDGGAGFLFFYQPFGRDWLRAHGPGGRWASAVSSAYEVELHGPDRAVSQLTGPAAPGPALSPAEVEYARGRLEQDMEWGNLDEPPFDIPERKPPLAALFFDRGGRLWIQKTAAGGAETIEADVYEGTTLVARYRWPRRVRAGALPWVTETALYGTTTDELGVQRAARVRFEQTR